VPHGVDDWSDQVDVLGFVPLLDMVRNDDDEFPHVREADGDRLAVALSSVENQASYFVDCVRKGRMPTVGTAAQARLAVLCAEATRRSLESGGVLAL
jgi:hypothetical protein